VPHQGPTHTAATGRVLARVGQAQAGAEEFVGTLLGLRPHQEHRDAPVAAFPQVRDVTEAACRNRTDDLLITRQRTLLPAAPQQPSHLQKRA